MNLLEIDEEDYAIYPKYYLYFEVTESQIMVNPEEAINILN